MLIARRDVSHGLGVRSQESGVTAVCDQVQYKNSYLNRVKKQSTMIKPIESIFISNSINRHSNC
ncbi:hypothetical protein, partial [Dolichospermum sp. LEGE 00240]|uniref:hypothetical protein n=1 Tax=Dolichospermum sp. LEGE 00240 TaxID=1828603 RepID=UPI001D13AD04